MSLINEYRATEEAIKELKSRLQILSENDALKAEIKFEGELRSLMAEHGKSLRDIIALLDPKASLMTGRSTRESAAKPRSARKIKQYTNPHNGEVIQTKGGNHKLLKEWKTKWGADEVEGWMKFVD